MPIDGCLIWGIDASNSNTMRIIIQYWQLNMQRIAKNTVMIRLPRLDSRHGDVV
jgi:hypothetical protein